MSNIAFIFGKENTTESMKIAIYKNDVLREDNLLINNVEPQNTLNVTFDTLIDEDSEGSGTHTIKLRLEAVDRDEDGSPVNVTLNSIEVDGVVCDNSNNFLKEHVTVYNPLTDDAAAGIADDSITSSGTGTFDLGLGDGSVEYYHGDVWSNGGLGTEGAVYVLEYDGNFTTWFNALNYYQ